MTSFLDFEEDPAFKAKQAGKSIVAARHEVKRRFGSFFNNAADLAELEQKIIMGRDTLDEIVAQHMGSISDPKAKLIRSIVAEWEVKKATDDFPGGTAEGDELNKIFDMQEKADAYTKRYLKEDDKKEDKKAGFDDPDDPQNKPAPGEDEDPNYVHPDTPSLEDKAPAEEFTERGSRRRVAEEHNPLDDIPPMGKRPSKEWFDSHQDFDKPSYDYETGPNGHRDCDHANGACSYTPNGTYVPRTANEGLQTQFDNHSFSAAAGDEKTCSKCGKGKDFFKHTGRVAGSSRCPSCGSSEVRITGKNDNIGFCESCAHQWTRGKKTKADVNTNTGVGTNDTEFPWAKDEKNPANKDKKNDGDKTPDAFKENQSKPLPEEFKKKEEGGSKDEKKDLPPWLKDKESKRRGNFLGKTADTQSPWFNDATDKVVDKIMDWESGNMSEEEEIAFFQELVDSGMAWQLQGMYGRAAQALIDAGLVHQSK